MTVRARIVKNMWLMLGLLLARQLRIPRGFSFDVTGDNTTSLSCCRRGRVASSLARRANIGFTLIAVALDASVAETTHIAGVDNVIYDGLSRGKDGIAVGLPPQLFVDLVPAIIQFVRLCDPSMPLESTEAHTNNNLLVIH
jgi:hypothetical protein